MVGLLKEERQLRILDALQEDKKATVLELSQRFGTSQVTIRRDLAELAGSGRLIRAHKGALALQPAPAEPPVIQRMSIGREDKDRIAKAAAGLVCEGDSIFVGSGSTMACFARHLAGLKRLTVITNAINVAAELASMGSDFVVVVLGGVVRAPELSLLGHISEQALAEVRFNKIFMGVQALSLESGWTTDHLPEVATTRKIIEMAGELIVLADHTKLGHIAAAWIAPVTRVTTLVTDDQADPVFLSQLQSIGVQVLVV
jgi:DeoR/GlpR family transcriptional regulator of sugar metabolism